MGRINDGPTTTRLEMSLLHDNYQMLRRSSYKGSWWYYTNHTLLQIVVIIIDVTSRKDSSRTGLKSYLRMRVVGRTMMRWHGTCWISERFTLKHTQHRCLWKKGRRGLKSRYNHVAKTHHGHFVRLTCPKQKWWWVWVCTIGTSMTVWRRKTL